MGTSRRRTPPAPVYAEPPKGARTAYRGTQKTSESLFGFKNESQNFFYWHTTTLDGERDRPRPHRPALLDRDDLQVRRRRHWRAANGFIANGFNSTEKRLHSSRSPTDPEECIEGSASFGHRKASRALPNRRYRYCQDGPPLDLPADGGRVSLVPAASWLCLLARSARCWVFQIPRHRVFCRHLLFQKLHYS
jgi:hypothetical protein